MLEARRRRTQQSPQGLNPDGTPYVSPLPSAPPPRLQPPGGGYSGGVIPRFQGGGSAPYPWDPTGCPSPKEHIQLANNDWILAGELKVGDEVMTSEEPQKVTRVQRLENRPRCEVLFEDSDSIVTSYSHPYFVNSKGFVEVGDLEKGDVVGDLVVKDTKPFAMGPVISLSVDKTETYMLQGGTKENPVPALSHNKSPVPQPPPPRDPNRPIKYYGPWGAPYTTEHRDRWLRRQQVKEGATARKTARTRRLGSRSPGGGYSGGVIPRFQSGEQIAQQMRANQRGVAGQGRRGLSPQDIARHQQMVRRNQHLEARGLPYHKDYSPYIPYMAPRPPGGGYSGGVVPSFQAGGQFPEPAFPVESELADESPWYPDEEVGYEEEFPTQGGFDIFGRSGG